MVFSSALHHLEDPVLVLRLAQGALAPGGVIVTIFDPLRMPKGKNIVLEAARRLDRAQVKPGLLLSRSVPVLKRLLKRSKDQKLAGGALQIDQDNVGYLAEFHGDTGFDDHALIREIRSRTTLKVVHHDRYIGHGGPIVTFTRRALRTPTSFKLLLRQHKPAIEP
jgi:hypothetical protein